MQSQGTHRSHRLSAVEERDTFFNLELQRFNLRATQSIGAGHALTIEENFALTDCRLCEVRQRRKITAGSHRSFFRNYRCHPAFEQRDQCLNHDWATTAKPQRQNIRAQK
jgi:hypothetical protein